MRRRRPAARRTTTGRGLPQWSAEEHSWVGWPRRSRNADC